MECHSVPARLPRRRSCDSESVQIGNRVQRAWWLIPGPRLHMAGADRHMHGCWPAGPLTLPAAGRSSGLLPWWPLLLECPPARGASKIPNRSPLLARPPPRPLGRRLFRWLGGRLPEPAPARRIPGGWPSGLVVDQRQQLAGGVGIAVGDDLQDLGDLANEG
jgi:hypothetical protein